MPPGSYADTVQYPSSWNAIELHLLILPDVVCGDKDVGNDEPEEDRAAEDRGELLGYRDESEPDERKGERN